MMREYLAGEIIKPNSPVVNLDEELLDNKIHPLVLVHNDGSLNKLFHLTSSKNYNSILSNIIYYKLTPGLNVQYNSQMVFMNTFIRCDQIHELTSDELYSCRRFFAFLTPDTKHIIEDIVSTHYFIYNFLRGNNVIVENLVSEELKSSIFYNDYEMYENNRYKKIINLLLNRNNYISFIKEINRKYSVNLDVDSTYYQYLQDVKNAYTPKENVSKRVA